MSQERKLLKICCFLLVVDAVACLALGVAAAAGADPASRPWALALGIWEIVAGILWLALAGAGIRGANTPRRVGPARALGVVGAVLAVAGIALAVVPGEVDAGVVAPAASLVLAVACAVLSGRVAEQAER